MFLKPFKKIFSVPNYISMPASGIEIGNRSVKYLEFQNVNGIATLDNFGIVPIGPNIIKNGDILNRDELIKALLIVKKHLKNSFVKVAIPEEKTYLFNLRIPYLKQNEIRSALEFKLEEKVPLKINESVFEFSLIKPSQNEKEDLFLNVSVIPTKTIEDYSDIFNEVGLNILSFETESRMVSRSLIPKKSYKTFMVVNIKDDSTTLSIVSQNVTCFTSSIPVGNFSFLESLKKILPDDFKNAKIIPEKILSPDDFYDGEVYASLFNIFSIIKDEIWKSNKYWDSQVESQLHLNDGFKKINDIILCGRASAIPGFVNYINQNVGINTFLGNVWENLFDLDKFLPDIKFFDSLDYGVVIGLAKPSKHKI